MGSADFYPEERPVHQVAVDGFWMDEHPVPAAQFRRFVRETKYVTVAERPLDPAQYPDADPDLLVPGSLVFRKTRGPVNLDDYRNWWEYVPDASWRHPGGPGTTINGRDHHPVVQIAYEDAEAYAAWVGKELPTEPSGSSRRVAGSTARSSPGATSIPGRKGDGEHLAGGVPLAEPEGRRLRGHVTGGQLPTERLRPLRHGRQRLGVDLGLVHAAASAMKRRSPCCVPSNPRVTLTRRTATTPASPVSTSRAG